jgi:hypothetical protein
MLITFTEVISETQEQALQYFVAKNSLCYEECYS